MKTLKAKYEDQLEDWIDNHQDRCSCHISPPCDCCTHKGHPVALLEMPEAWEDGHGIYSQEDVEAYVS